MDINETPGVSVHSGFPNAAADARGRALDFNQLLIQRPSSTFCFRIRGAGHEDHGIFDGDIAVVDRALSPRPSDLILYWHGDSFAISRYSHLDEAETYWGVVTSTIRMLRGKE